MAYEIYQSRHKGYEIDNLLDDVKEIKPKVESMEQSYPVDKVVMADGTTLPLYIAKDLINKQDLADAIKNFETSTEIQQDIANATKDFKTETEIQQMISQSAYTLPEATDTTLGGVKVDGTTIVADPDGTIHGASNIKKISDIGDVEFTDLEDGDVMKYDAANEKWVNVKGGGSGDVPENTVLYDEEIIKDQFIGNVSDYTISGDYPQNVEIHDDYIRLWAATYSMFQRTLANYKKPFSNKGKLEFKIRNDGNGAYTYIGYYIGTGKGKNDLYESPRLVLDNVVRTFEIDLTQFTNDELYLTLAVEIYSGNGVDAKVLSIIHEYKNGETTLVNLHGDVLNPKIDMGDLALLSDEKSIVSDKYATWLKDKENNIVAPRTLVNVVQDVNGKTLDKILEDLPSGGGASNLYYSMDDYSEKEHVIGKWKDGKPLYRCISISRPDDIDYSLNEKIIKETPTVPVLDDYYGENGRAIESRHDGTNYGWYIFSQKPTVNEWAWYPAADNQWVGYYFNEAIVINKFMLMQEIATPAYFRNYSFQASDDGTNWDDLGYFDDSNLTYAGAVSNHYVNNSKPYHYYRWLFYSTVSVQCAQLYSVSRIYEYTKTTDEPDSFKPSLMTNNTLLPVAPSYDDYSEEEIVVGKWIDGKPVYRKVIEFNSVNNTGVEYKHKHNISDIDNIIDYSGYLIESSGNSIPIPMMENYDVYTWSIVTKDEVNIKTKTWGGSGCNIRFILEYTKTTDAENSFTPDMIKTIPLTDEVKESDVAEIISVLGG